MKEIIGKIIEANDSSYRVIFVDDKFVYLIKMDIKKNQRKMKKLFKQKKKRNQRRLKKKNK